MKESARRREKARKREKDKWSCGEACVQTSMRSPLLGSTPSLSPVLRPIPQLLPPAIPPSHPPQHPPTLFVFHRPLVADEITVHPSVPWLFSFVDSIYNLREENRQLRKAHQEIHVQLQDARVRQRRCLVSGHNLRQRCGGWLRPMSGM